MARRSPQPLVLFLLAALLCLIWGSTWVVIEGGLEDLPPFGSAALRFALAALGMSALAHLFAEREGGGPPTLGLTLVLGTLNFGVSYGIVYWSETKLPSGLVSVLWAVYPMLQAISGHFALPSERLGLAQLSGFVVGFLGVASLFLTDLRAIGPEAVASGAVLLVSPLVSAIGTTYVKKHAAGTSSLRMNRNAMWLGAAWLAAVAFATERDESMTFTRGAVFSVLYLSLCGTVVAFGLYFWLLRHVPANRLSVISYVTPAIALVLGVWLRDEPVTEFTLAGLALILLGVLLVHRGGRRAGTDRSLGQTSPALSESSTPSST